MVTYLISDDPWLTHPSFAAPAKPKLPASSSDLAGAAWSRAPIGQLQWSCAPIGQLCPGNIGLWQFRTKSCSCRVTTEIVTANGIYFSVSILTKSKAKRTQKKVLLLLKSKWWGWPKYLERKRSKKRKNRREIQTPCPLPRPRRSWYPAR